MGSNSKSVPKCNNKEPSRSLEVLTAEALTSKTSLLFCWDEQYAIFDVIQVYQETFTLMLLKTPERLLIP